MDKIVSLRSTIDYLKTEFDENTPNVSFHYSLPQPHFHKITKAIFLKHIYQILNAKINLKYSQSETRQKKAKNQ